jgi:hypothetical protein
LDPLSFITTCALTHQSVREFLVKKCIPVLPRAPHYPDCSPCDFCLCPKLKSRLKGHHFQTPDSIQKAITDANWEDPKKRWLPILLENSLGQLCCIREMLFWRGQRWLRHKTE